MPFTLFASDLHLAPARPALTRAFIALTRGAARDADALYLLGDIFDAWIGDDQMRDAPAREVAQALRALTASGVKVGVMRGNRDFLLGERFAAATGSVLLADETVIDLYGRPTLLLHGDELCQADQKYQRYRAWVRDRPRQQRFLLLPYMLRKGVARLIRGQSTRSTALKPEMITDVTAEAVAEAFRRHGVDRMIHGHTHRPALHRLTVEGRDCERWVLADWYERGSVLEMTPGGSTLREIAPLD